MEQVPLPPVPQQDSPAAPQVEHALPALFSTHPRAPVQALTPPSTAGPPVAVQQGSPDPPHAEQVPGVPCPAFRPVHTIPDALQVPAPVPQQDCPDPPQVPHTFPEAASTQDCPVTVHWVAPAPPPAQQGSPSPPHAEQVPGVPCPAFRPVHAVPVAVQVPPPAPAPAPAPQQDCPEPPQAPHTLPLADTMQASPVAVHWVAPAPPAQQACPEPPHAAHTFPPVHAKPVLHVAPPNPFPGQHD